MKILDTSDQARVSYRVLGQGPTLLFLHGWSSGAAEWLPYAQALAERFRVICWTARGHDATLGSDSEQMSLDRMARDLHELLSLEAPTGALVVGHSMGALTAWAYIGRYGCERLTGLCILDQSPRLLTGPDWSLGVYGDFSPARNKAFIQRLRTHFPEAVTRLICARLDDPAPLPKTRYLKRLQEYLAGLPSELLTQCWESLTQADLRPILSRIAVPTLLIYGDRSQFYGPAVARWVQSQIPGSRLIRYPEADHSPHLGACRDAFLQDLGAFSQHCHSKNDTRAQG
nr:alpha/beta hydrolase [Motiliproteus sp. SC1-56]